MKTTKKYIVSTATAEAVVRAWMADAQFGALLPNDELPFYPQRARVRTMLGERNSLAQDAAFDGNYNRAYLLIRRFGFDDARRFQERPNNRRSTLRLAQNTLEMQAAIAFKQDSGGSPSTKLTARPPLALRKLHRR